LLDFTRHTNVLFLVSCIIAAMATILGKIVIKICDKKIVDLPFEMSPGSPGNTDCVLACSHGSDGGRLVRVF